MPRLSTVIVTYNSRRDIDACLHSITGATQAVSREIVVVDNASPDATAAHVRAHWPDVQTIDAGGNLGFSRANNRGIGATSGELVLLLNPDTRVPTGGLDRLIAAMVPRPDVAVVGPRLIDDAGRAELSWGAMISPLAELRQKLLVVGNDRRWPLIPRLVERLTRTPRDVDWVSGACLLIRRADLEAVGLLDERFFMYTEDVDLCAAVRARGRRVRFDPSVEVVHRRGQSRLSARRATQIAYRRSQVLFYEKYHPRWVPWLRAYLNLKGELPP